MEKKNVMCALLTCDDFNEKYKEYLEQGFEGLTISDNHVIMYLDKLFADLIKIEGFKYSQVKLKFGMVRFYGNNISHELCYAIEDKIADIIRQKMRKK